MENQETNISIDTYRKVVEHEIQSLRMENLNLKVVIAQLQEDKKLLEDTLSMAEKISKDEKKKSVPLAEVRTGEYNLGSI